MDNAGWDYSPRHVLPLSREVNSPAGMRLAAMSAFSFLEWALLSCA
jgi:hypothetical protein